MLSGTGNGFHMLPSILPQLAELWFLKRTCAPVVAGSLSGGRRNLDGNKSCVVSLLCGSDDGSYGDEAAA